MERFRRDFPGLFINVVISEQNLVSVAAGLAMEGKRVFIYAIIPFVTLRCLEQIKVDLCVMNLPVAIIGAGAGFTYSSDGPTHHAIEDVSVMRALPRMTIYNPDDQITAQYAARQAWLGAGPVYVRLDKGIWPLLREPNEDLSAGFSMLRSGCHVLIIATGSMIHVALKVADAVGESGISAGVVGLYRLKPIAAELFESARKFQLVVTLEEHTLAGGMGGAVAELFVDHGALLPIVRFGVKDVYPEGYGDRDWMRRDCGLDIESLASRVMLELHRVSCEAMERSMKFEPSNGKVHSLDISSISRLLGVAEEEFSDEALRFIDSANFDYRIVEGADRERLLLQILNTIDSGTLSVSGPGKRIAWERGWSETLLEFERSGNDPETLLPKFVRKGQVMRMQGSFILPSNSNFEIAMVKVMREVLFRKYFSRVRSIFEFGCGTGLNLLHLARMFPEKPLYGLDWAHSSCDIVNRLAKTQGLNLKAIRFDMYSPDSGLDLTSADGVFTIGALEQLGTGFGPFLSFLCDKCPAMCVHFETMNELYNDATLSDHLIKRYSKARKYLDGFLAALRELEQSGSAEILQVQRTFGGLYHEGYSFVVWRPLNGGT
ncbi:MAG: methyltransferase domain-containing protein [Syntrophobacteraceae bacterium]|nr:methyltransferase domain-containing protein [Syntrophobacteraceae bacterium]